MLSDMSVNQMLHYLTYMWNLKNLISDQICCYQGGGNVESQRNNLPVTSSSAIIYNMMSTVNNTVLYISKFLKEQMVEFPSGPVARVSLPMQGALVQSPAQERDPLILQLRIACHN